MRKTKILPFSRRSAFRLSITLSIILNAIIIIGYFSNKNNGFVDLWKLFFAFGANFILFFSLYTYNFNIIQRKTKRKRKFWIAFFGSVIIAAVVTLIFEKLRIILSINFPIAHRILLVANFMTDLIIIIIVLLSTYLLNSIYEHQHTLLENEKLIAENIRIRYEVLKNQVDPHFLFNSLNTLDGLITIDTNRAHDYVQNLASVFRYAISNKEIMNLDEELNFTESYASLMRIRYGENLQIRYTIDDKYRIFYIMPISLQLLVENAIKHNVISNKQPLVIHIESTSNDTIKVWNVIQPKIDADSGEGIGLANLTERYNLLFQKEIIITSSDVFCVEIPLIKQLHTANNEPEIRIASKRFISCKYKK